MARKTSPARQGEGEKELENALFALAQGVAGSAQGSTKPSVTSLHNRWVTPEDHALLVAAASTCVTEVCMGLCPTFGSLAKAINMWTLSLATSLPARVAGRGQAQAGRGRSIGLRLRRLHELRASLASGIRRTASRSVGFQPIRLSWPGPPPQRRMDSSWRLINKTALMRGYI